MMLPKGEEGDGGKQVEEGMRLKPSLFFVHTDI